MSSLAPLPDEAAPRHVGRSTIAMILIVLGSLLAPVAIVGWYVRGEILDTDRFVAVVTPLATDTAIQDALIDRVTVEIVRRADAVQPGLMTADQVEQIARSYLASPQFTPLWELVVRETHAQVREVLLGRDTELSRTVNGQVVLNLGALARQVQQRLVEGGLTVAGRIDLSGADWTLPLFESRELAAAQRATNALVDAVPWLVIATLVAFGLALVVAPKRGVALLWIGIGLLLGALVTALGVAIARGRYLDAIQPLDVPRDAARAAYQVLVDPLVDGIRMWIGLALLLVGAGALLSPWRRQGEPRPRPMTAGQWASGHRVGLVTVVAAVGLGVVVLWHQPTLVVVVITAGIVAAVGVAVFLFTGRAGRDLPA